MRPRRLRRNETAGEGVPGPMKSATSETSHAAFQRYVEPELPVLFRVARRMTGSTADAEDLVQETVMRAFRAIDRFDGRHPRAWLLTILRNTLYSQSRKRTPHLLYDQDREMDRVEAAGADGRGGAEEIALHGQLDSALENALSNLPSKFRDVVLLVDVEGLSYQEAADALGIPIGTVMSRLHRARNRLRDALDAAGYPGPREEA